MIRKFTPFLLATAAITIVTTPALAQNTTSAANELTTAGVDAPNPDAQGAQGGGDIVVTAQRRSESLQKVPIAVTAISSEMVHDLNLKDLKSFQIITPGLSFTTSFNYASTYIRGVGANFSSPGVENPVAVYVDGAYVERAMAGNLDTFDVGSIQILKGPQGTLWGRNSTAGVILVNTADPTFETSGRLVGEFGNQGHRSIEGAVNVPLSDTLAVRVSGRFRQDGGYIRNLPDNYMFGWATQYGIRGKLLFRPTDDFSAVLGIEHGNIRRSLPANAQGLPNVYCALCSQTGYTYPLADPYTTTISLVDNGLGSETTSDIYNLNMKYKVGNFAISSTTSYNKGFSYEKGDFDLTNISAEPLFVNGLNFAYPSGNKTFFQSLNVTSNFGGIIDGMVGVDYLNDRSKYAITFFVNLQRPFPADNFGFIQTESISPYAEVNLRPMPGLTLTGGLRYTDDKRYGQRAGVADTSVHFTGFSPRLVVAYEAGPVNLYVSYNKGTKAGGINSPVFTLTTFLPETLHAFEAGLKFVSDNRRLRMNLAAFTYNYKQLQTQAIDQSDPNNIGRVQNPDGKIKGIDFDVNWTPADGIDLFGGGTFLDSKFVNFANAGVQVPVFNAQGAPIGLAAGTEDLSGHRMPHAPKFTFFLGANLSANLSEGWKGKLTGVVYHSSSFDTFPGAGGPLRADIQPAYTTVKLSGSVMPIDERIELGFYIDNLTNAKVYDIRFTTAPWGQSNILDRKRTFGMRLGLKF